MSVCVCVCASARVEWINTKSNITIIQEHERRYTALPGPSARLRPGLICASPHLHPQSEADKQSDFSQLPVSPPQPQEEEEEEEREAHILSFPASLWPS